MVNCTLTGNVAYNRSNYGGGFYATTDATVETKEAVLVNNIFAYNYSMAVPTGETDTIHRNLDMYFGARPIVYSEKNIIASARQADNAPVTIKSPVAFFYDDQDANYDDPLFENYTTNKFGHKIPAYNPETWTVALAENGVATGKALSKDMVIDPEIEALIPEKDQRGVTRSATPSLGSYEYQYPNSTDDLLFNKKSVIILSNPVKDMLRINTSLKISRLDIVDLTGKTVFSQRNPNSTVELNHIPAGHYIVRFENETGVTMEKLIVQ